MDLVDFALEEYPDNLPLMSLKVHLEEKVNGGEAAILTAKGEEIMLESLFFQFIMYECCTFIHCTCTIVG